MAIKQRLHTIKEHKHPLQIHAITSHLKCSSPINKTVLGWNDESRSLKQHVIEHLVFSEMSYQESNMTYTENFLRFYFRIMPNSYWYATFFEIGNQFRAEPSYQLVEYEP